jgi:hypothetical protein
LGKGQAYRASTILVQVHHQIKILKLGTRVGKGKMQDGLADKTLPTNLFDAAVFDLVVSIGYWAFSR